MLKLKFISSRAAQAVLVQYILRTISQFQSFFLDIKTVLNKAVCDSHSPLSHVREDKRSCKNNTFSSQTAAQQQKHWQNCLAPFKHGNIITRESVSLSLLASCDLIG